jgi:hypothetical protein
VRFGHSNVTASAKAKIPATPPATFDLSTCAGMGAYPPLNIHHRPTAHPSSTTTMAERAHCFTPQILASAADTAGDLR